MVYVIQVCWQLASRIRKVPSWSCLQAVWHVPLLCAQWKTRGDGRRNCPKHVEYYLKNKFEKSVRLVGFITGIAFLCIWTVLHRICAFVLALQLAPALLRLQNEKKKENIYWIELNYPIPPLYRVLQSCTWNKPRFNVWTAYNVVVFLQLEFMLHVMLFPMLNVMYNLY